jgi:tRNA (guanine37-N1)-methyltransferase
MNKGNLKQALEKKLTKIELSLFVRSFDVIGDITILEIPPKLVTKQKLIAATLLSLHPNIKSIYKKSSPHSGEYRTQKLTYLAGKRTKETIYKENNIRLKLDVEKVYFSPRLANERLRIVNQVKPNENILVLFSGCGPYSFNLSKNTKAKKIYSIELNPTAHKYALINKQLNKSENTEFINGDVSVALPSLLKITKLRFDRIIMPLPKTASDFLESVFPATKQGTIIHFYNFQHQDEFNKARDIIKTVCKKYNKRCKILKVVKCGQNAPRFFRICIDFKIL